MAQRKTKITKIHRQKPARFKKHPPPRTGNGRYSISHIIGLFDGPPDLSQRHDEYLYSKKESPG